MSPRAWQLRAMDMLEAIDRIQQYTVGLTLTTFATDSLVLDAVIRNIAVIGEASVHIPPEVQGRLPSVRWAAIRGARNAMIHEYFSIDEEVLWDTIVRDLPSLRSALQRLLDQEETPTTPPG